MTVLTAQSVPSTDADRERQPGEVWPIVATHATQRRTLQLSKRYRPELPEYKIGSACLTVGLSIVVILVALILIALL